ncbi:MAG: hypothetical protein SGILL_007843 [Bacillariaceae sp.]
MRFAIAAAILAHSLPATSEESTSQVAAGVSDTFVKEVMKTVEEAPRGKFLGVIQEKKKLAGGWQTKAEKKVFQECDPESDDADTGVLSCGAGTFCAESDESTKGGFCVSSPDELDRNLQETVTLFDGLYSVFCSEDAYYASDCNCTGADPEAYTLDVVCMQPQECTNYTSTCDANVTSCIEYDFSFSLNGAGTYVVDRCFEDTAPYYQRTCYQLTAVETGVPEECTISMDGEDCFSCTVDTNEEGDYCYQFDCTNTISRRAGDLCQEGVYVAPILYYLRTYGCDAYVCPICGGEDFVSTNPGGAVDLGDGVTTCAAIAQVALLGGFNETFCQDEVIPFVATPCGCVAFGSPPVEGPTLAPAAATPAPSEQDSAFPTITPIIVTFPPTPAPSSAFASTKYAAATLVGLSMMAVSQFF